MITASWSGGPERPGIDLDSLEQRLGEGRKVTSSDPGEGAHVVRGVLLHRADGKGPFECHTGEWHRSIVSSDLGGLDPQSRLGQIKCRPRTELLRELREGFATHCDKMAESPLLLGGSLATSIKSLRKLTQRHKFILKKYLDIHTTIYLRKSISVMFVMGKNGN